MLEEAKSLRELPVLHGRYYQVNKDPFKEYIRQSEPDKRDKGYAWHTAIGLQAVDGLKTSEYLMRTAVRNIEGEISFDEANALLQAYYEENPSRAGEDRTEEADKVSARIAAFDVTNGIFAENAWYFRNSLVRANYNDMKSGIHETTEFLELFLKNLLLNENHPLHNRTLYIRGTVRTPEKANMEGQKVNIEDQKVNIEDQKPNIESEKANIRDSFTAKTAFHVCELLEAFGSQTVFGRSDVQKILGLKPTRSTALIHEMAEKGFIEPVTGLGKGKYRFKQRWY